MGDIIISLFNMSSIKVDENKLLIHLGDMLNNHEGGSYMEIDRSEFIRKAVSCFFISDLVNGSVFSKICSVPQIAAEDITVLAKKTKLYKDFIAKFPSGEMDRKHFVKHFTKKYEELAKEKLLWIFDVCDKNGKDVLEGIEIDNVVTGLFAMVGIRIDKSILAARTEELVETIDHENGREITKSEFVNNAVKCDFFSDIINDDVVNGLSQL